MRFILLSPGHPEVRVVSQSVGKLVVVNLAFLLLTQVAPLFPASTTPRKRFDPLQIRLRIYTHARVPREVIERGAKQAGHVFRAIGIETAWLHCPTSPEHAAANRTCADPLGAADFVIRVLPRAMSKRYGLPKAVFGFSLPTREGRLGRTVNLFYRRVVDMAYYGSVGGGFETAQAIILGHVLAHEIGHLLLGPGSHAESGIMSFPWGQKQLVDASRRRLRFTQPEAAKIQKRLRTLRGSSELNAASSSK